MRSLDKLGMTVLEVNYDNGLEKVINKKFA